MLIVGFSWSQSSAQSFDNWDWVCRWHTRVAGLRSRDFGSPQCRMRLYVVGVRANLISPGDFNAMINYIKNFLPGVHRMTGITDVVRAVEKLGVAHVAHNACTKDTAWAGTVLVTWTSFGPVDIILIAVVACVTVLQCYCYLCCLCCHQCMLYDMFFPKPVAHLNH